MAPHLDPTPDIASLLPIAAEVAHARRTHCLLSSDDAEEAARCLRAHLRRSRVLSGAVSMPVEARGYLHLWRARQLATAAHAGEGGMLEQSALGSGLVTGRGRRWMVLPSIHQWPRQRPYVILGN